LTKIARDPEISPCTAGEYLNLTKPTTVISIPEGSWGEGGYHYIWLNQWTEWTWQKIYAAEARLSSLLGRAGTSLSRPPLADILKQAARELLLLQASDWQFLISTWAARDYAELRLAEHFEKFSRLADFGEKMLNGLTLTAEEETYLRDCESQDNLFPDLDLAWFHPVEFPAQ
jgi:1,4-alpha-glucan branching enzyme